MPFLLSKEYIYTVIIDTKQKSMHILYILIYLKTVYKYTSMNQKLC